MVPGGLRVLRGRRSRAGRSVMRLEGAPRVVIWCRVDVGDTKYSVTDAKSRPLSRRETTQNGDPPGPEPAVGTRKNSYCWEDRRPPGASERRTCDKTRATHRRSSSTGGAHLLRLNILWRVDIVESGESRRVPPRPACGRPEKGVDEGDPCLDRPTPCRSGRRGRAVAPARWPVGCVAPAPEPCPSPCACNAATHRYSPAGLAGATGLIGAGCHEAPSRRRSRGPSDVRDPRIRTSVRRCAQH